LAVDPAEREQSLRSRLHFGSRFFLSVGAVFALRAARFLGRDSYMTSGLQANILKLPKHWVQSWLPDPNFLVGRAILRDSRWGQALSPMVRQPTPELVAAPPLPHGVLVDQLGAILPLIAGEPEPARCPICSRRFGTASVSVVPSRSSRQPTSLPRSKYRRGSPESALY